MQRAIERLESLKTYLDTKCKVDMVDLFSEDMNCADTYMSINGEDVRKMWVKKWLKKLGYSGIVDDDMEIADDM